MSTFLVERYWPALSVAAIRTAARRLPPTITVLEIIVLDDEDVCLLVVDGPSAEAVARAFVRAGLPMDRIGSAIAARTAGT